MNSGLSEKVAQNYLDGWSFGRISRTYQIKKIDIIHHIRSKGIEVKSSDLIYRKQLSIEDVIQNSSVDKNGCWVWPRLKKGMYAIKYNTIVTRFVADFFYGDVFGRVVCHKCDNTHCVNPEHLFIGTKQDNTIDLFMKGLANCAKLNPEKVRDISNEYAHGFPINYLSQKYGVMDVVIESIVNRKIWKFVK